MAIHNIFKQIAYESIHVLTISVKLQLGYVNQNKIVWYSDNFNFKTSLEFRIEAKTHLRQAYTRFKSAIAIAHHMSS